MMPEASNTTSTKESAFGKKVRKRRDVQKKRIFFLPSQTFSNKQRREKASITFLPIMSLRFGLIVIVLLGEHALP